LRSVGRSHGIDGDYLGRVYKDHLSDYEHWDQKAEEGLQAQHDERLRVGEQSSGMERRVEDGLYGHVKKSKSPGMKTFMRTIKEREEDLLNYYETFVTNASAESLNSGIKGFRAELHGISNLPFFFYRVCKIYG